MMKRTVKKVLALTLIFVIGAACFVLPASAEEHWADAYLQRARGWIEAAFDEAPGPDDVMTGEQLLIMTCEAMGITPGSSFEDFILHGQRYPDKFYSSIPEQVENSKMVSRGYYLPAMWFGFTSELPGSYESYFVPAERSSAFSMVIRGLGLVNAAAQYPADSAFFADWEQLNEIYQSRIGLLTECGIITGDAEGCVRINDPITVGEAAAVLCRAYDYMTEGMDAEIQVTACYKDGTSGAAEVHLPVPVQIVDNIVFVPGRTLFQAGNWLYHSKPGEMAAIFSNNMTLKGVWSKESQSISCEYYKTWKGYFAGYNLLADGSGENLGYGYKRPEGTVVNHRYDYRMLFGEVMVPVLDLSNETFFESEYDADTKTLLLQPPHPNDSF